MSSGRCPSRSRGSLRATQFTQGHRRGRGARDGARAVVRAPRSGAALCLLCVPRRDGRGGRIQLPRAVRRRRTPSRPVGRVWLDRVLHAAGRAGRSGAHRRLEPANVLDRSAGQHRHDRHPARRGIRRRQASRVRHQGRRPARRAVPARAACAPGRRGAPGDRAGLHRFQAPAPHARGARDGDRRVSVLAGSCRPDAAVQTTHRVVARSAVFPGGVRQRAARARVARGREESGVDVRAVAADDRPAGVGAPSLERVRLVPGAATISRADRSPDSLLTPPGFPSGERWLAWLEQQGSALPVPRGARPVCRAPMSAGSRAAASPWSCR